SQEAQLPAGNSGEERVRPMRGSHATLDVDLRQELQPLDSQQRSSLVDSAQCNVEVPILLECDSHQLLQGSVAQDLPPGKVGVGRVSDGERTVAPARGSWRGLGPVVAGSERASCEGERIDSATCRANG